MRSRRSAKRTSRRPRRPATAIVKATTDAIAYCDGAFTALTDATAGQMVAAPFGSNQIPRTAALIGQIGHDNEHYGNLVTYFRMKGMVPPSSKRQ